MKIYRRCRLKHLQEARVQTNNKIRLSGKPAGEFFLKKLVKAEFIGYNIT